MGLIPYRGRDRQSHASIVPAAPRPARAGEVAHVSLSLKNDNAETIHCALCATDLIGVSGHRIPASHLRVSPNPAGIPAAGSTDVQIEIRVPSGTPAGRFTGLLQSDDGESVRALVQLTVGIDSPSSFSVLPAPRRPEKCLPYRLAAADFREPRDRTFVRRFSTPSSAWPRSRLSSRKGTSSGQPRMG